MAITTIQAGTNPRPPFASPPKAEQGFAALLGCPLLSAPATRDAQQTAPLPPLPSEGQSPAPLIQLGEINAATPSASHLLQRHPELREQCWEIIFAEVNQGKEFTHMRPGVKVSLNPTTKELVWEQVQGRPSAKSDAPPPLLAENPAPLVLGAIGPETPTISHLLRGDPRFHTQAWEIIFSEVNRGKPYASLRPGSLVAIHPQTLELSFPDRAPQPVRTAPPPPPVAEVESSLDPTSVPEQREFAARLTESVRSYLGRPYQSLDCYGLVVRGLKDQGVQYHGEHGLRQHLERQAREQGLPPNAYHNGEGLIEFTGHKLYDHSFARVTDVERQAREVLTQLTPLLQEGMLLSFSTPSRGHTGVIAQKEGQWTYVNSGVIDHEVEGGKKVSWRVGEETLAAEIKNWLQLAKEDTTSLKVSAGVFDPQKLKTTANLTADGSGRGGKGPPALQVAASPTPGPSRKGRGELRFY